MTISMCNEFGCEKNGEKALARQYGVSCSNIRMIVLGRTWKHLIDSTQTKLPPPQE